MAQGTIVVAALGWALLDFLWQGLVVGLVAALALHGLRNARPQARYAIACLALAACLALPIAGLVKEIEAAGGSVLFVRTDVAKGADVDAMVKAAVARFGRIDCAFNNAGIEEEQAKLAESDEALYDRMMAINVKGVWLCMRAEIAQMLAQGGGAIVNTASVAGLVGAPRHAIYAASKHAVVGLTKSAAVEYGKGNIRINSVCPGVIRTAMLERALERNPAWEAGILALHPIGRLGEVDDVVSAVLFLCSEQAQFLCGHQLVVDGGMTVV